MMKKIFYTLSVIQSFFLFQCLHAEDLDAPPPSFDQSQWTSFALLAVVFILIYLLLWRPEQKRRKELEQQRSTLKKGDRVTALGILGTVIRVQENTVILKMYDGSKIEVLKGTINDVTSGSEDDVKKAEKEDRTLEAINTEKK
jgi:preprotein translocase subunit YajC